MIENKKLHPEWEAEIRKRLTEIKAGKAKLIDADKVFERYKAKRDSD